MLKKKNKNKTKPAFKGYSIGKIDTPFLLLAIALLAIGLVLFLCCDTVIGLNMAKTYLPIPSDALLYRVINPGFDLAWACYLPSQVLITLSLLVGDRKSK